MISGEPIIQRIMDRFRLAPLSREGGFFRQTYQSQIDIPEAVLTPSHKGARPAGSAIYYLITPESFSALHRLKSDELWHFYAGDPVIQLQLFPEAGGKILRIGTDWEEGAEPQALVPAGVWQGTRLVPGGRYALIGNTVHPGFDVDDYEQGEAPKLIQRYPQWRDEILKLTHQEEEWTP